MCENGHSHHHPHPHARNHVEPDHAHASRREFLRVLMGGALAGVVGALVSVPTAALVMVLVDEYLVKRKPAEAGKAAAAD